MSRRALGELRARHLPECVELVSLLPEGSGTLADVGTGGGLPGLVIAAARPDLEVTLIEATAKKARFLEETAGRMGCAVEVINERVEALARRRRFDLVTARAVAPLPRLVEWCEPLLARPAGRLYAVKGASWRREVAEAREAMDRTGLGVQDVAERELGDAPPLRVVIIART